MATGIARSGSFSTAPDGTSVDQFAVSRRKELISIPWYHQLVMEGKCYIANIGTETTPISFADTTWDLNQPRVNVDVPTGTTIIPLTLDIYLEDSAGTNNEYVWATSTNLVGVGTSTTITPANMRTDLPETTTCTVRSMYTGDCTTQTGRQEFARFGDPFVEEAASNTGTFRWSALANVPPVVVGPGSLQMNASGTGTAPGGFVIVIWAELKTVEAK